MAILTETDSRPGLIGYEETNKPLYSDIETETTKKIIREHVQKKQGTILDLTLNEIIDNIVTMVGDFSRDYMLKIHEINLEEEMNGEEETILNNYKKYILALMLYLGDKNNLLYFGIILVFLSIILYFFNISNQ